VNGTLFDPGQVFEFVYAADKWQKGFERLMQPPNNMLQVSEGVFRSTTVNKLATVQMLGADCSTTRSLFSVGRQLLLVSAIRSKFTWYIHALPHACTIAQASTVISHACFEVERLMPRGSPETY
jgi:hypothetical protein